MELRPTCGEGPSSKEESLGMSIIFHVTWEENYQDILG